MKTVQNFVPPQHLNSKQWALETHYFDKFQLWISDFGSRASLEPRFCLPVPALPPTRAFSPGPIIAYQPWARSSLTHWAPKPRAPVPGPQALGPGPPLLGRKQFSPQLITVRPEDGFYLLLGHIYDKLKF